MPALVANPRPSRHGDTLHIPNRPAMKIMDLTTHCQKPSRRGFPGRGGFTLVVSLMMMILLATLSVGMLGLASITLRTFGSSFHRTVQSACRVSEV